MFLKAFFKKEKELNFKNWITKLCIFKKTNYAIKSSKKKQLKIFKKENSKFKNIIKIRPYLKLSN